MSSPSPPPQTDLPVFGWGECIAGSRDGEYKVSTPFSTECLAVQAEDSSLGHIPWSVVVPPQELVDFQAFPYYSPRTSREKRMIPKKKLDIAGPTGV